MKHLYFSRHGLSEMNVRYQRSGHTDTLLHPDGHEQAKHAGRKAKQENMHFDLIISSPLQRAHDTAKHIAAELGYDPAKIILDDRLKERNFGSLEGKRDTPRMIAGYMRNEAYIDKYDQVEKLADLQKRLDAFYKHVQTLPAETILVVAHGASGRALHRSINNIPLTQKPTRFKNAEIHKFI